MQAGESELQKCKIRWCMHARFWRSVEGRVMGAVEFLPKADVALDNPKANSVDAQLTICNHTAAHSEDV